MANIELIGEHVVLKGLDIETYLKAIGVNPKDALTKENKPISSYDELCDFLEELCERNGGCDPIWDYPLDEMKDDTVEDNGNIYIEIYNGSEPKYFETLIPVEKFIENFKKQKIGG